VLCNIWAIHSNPDRFEDPHLFKPERFLNHTMSMAESIAQGDPFKRDHFAFGAGK
jgi:cytochrome P450